MHSARTATCAIQLQELMRQPVQAFTMLPSVGLPAKTKAATFAKQLAVSLIEDVIDSIASKLPGWAAVAVSVLDDVGVVALSNSIASENVKPRPSYYVVTALAAQLKYDVDTHSSFPGRAEARTIVEDAKRFLFERGVTVHTVKAHMDANLAQNSPDGFVRFTFSTSMFNNLRSLTSGEIVLI